MTTERAEIEIARLQKIIQENKKSEIPIPLPEPDFSPLIEMAKSHINEISNEGFADENSDHWFYEAVMECVYGKNVWEWINKNSN